MPLAVLAPTLLALVAQLALDLRAGRSRGRAAVAEGQARRERRAGLLLLALVTATDLLGLVPATALLALAAGRWAGQPLPRAVLLAGAVLVMLHLGLGALGVRLPPARLASLLPGW